MFARYQDSLETTKGPATADPTSARLLGDLGCNVKELAHAMRHRGGSIVGVTQGDVDIGPVLWVAPKAYKTS